MKINKLIKLNTNILANNFLRSVLEFIDLIVPRICIVCNRKLLSTEKFLCFDCHYKLPETNHNTLFNNTLERQLREHIDIARACALLNYNTKSKYNKIIHNLKYNNQPQIGEFFGEKLGYFVAKDSILSGADYICPVPLHPNKLKKRGYNQSYHIAIGISKVLNIPIDNEHLIRIQNNKSQTKMNRAKRMENIQNNFALTCNNVFAGKHVILVDDVVTTGATIESCVYAIIGKCDTKISILSLASA